jgi:lysophospholipase L1-like esterase
MGMWTEPFSSKLSEQNGPALLNMGISGNRLLRDTHMLFLRKTQFFGLAGLTRFPWDVAALPGVRVVIIALGINDIALPGGKQHRSLSELCSEETLIAGYEKLISMCKEQNLKTVGCTITPFGGYITHNVVTERIRKTVNDWILHSGAFDMTVDFASALQDAEKPGHLLSAYDSGDHIHPSALGGEQMSACIDINTLIHLAR